MSDNWVVTAYEQEREDERAFWSTTSALLLGIFTLVAAGATTSLRLTWFTWAFLPLILFPLFIYFFHQSVIGAGRRNLLYALELRLTEGNTEALELNGAHVQYAPYSRNAWSVNTNDPWTSREGRNLFILNNVVPLALPVIVIVGSFIKTIDGNGWHVGFGIGTFIAWTALYGLTLRWAGKLMNPAGLKRMWESEPRPRLVPPDDAPSE